MWKYLIYIFLIQKYEKYVAFIFFCERNENYPKTTEKCNPLLEFLFSHVEKSKSECMSLTYYHFFKFLCVKFHSKLFLVHMWKYFISFFYITCENI